MVRSDTVRVGVIGAGHMGSTHARNLRDGKVSGATLAAVSDPGAEALLSFSDVARFASSSELIRSGAVDAVLIATPHYAHTPLTIEALEQGLHVLVEKPLAVHKADCEAMLSAYARRPNGGQVFAEMFNQRTDPRFCKLRALIQAGELGALRRVNWIITDWFRSEAYYQGSSWRATWAGEGGGVLLNQAPHNLDLWQWLFGMPARIRAFCGFGRFHEIEVEDQVTAYFEYASGATGVFVTTTGEAPGTNRLEVAGDMGKVVLDSEGLAFTRNEVSAAEFIKTSLASFSPPPVWHVRVPVTAGGANQHVAIVQNFANAILHDEPLIAPAVEGVHSVELANAMIYSSLTEKTVELPLDSAAYASELTRLRAASRAR
jgi:predicted dehydrogenase